VRHLCRRFPEARVREVPVVRAAELDASADPSGGTRVWLALEQLQVTGSFKVRGALVAVARAMDRGRVVTASAGNHGSAVAYAACVLGASATVVVPRTVSPATRDRIQRYGAELVVAASNLSADAEALGQEIAMTQGATYVSARDDVDVTLGSGASVGFEIVRALGGVPERLLAPFGGGALSIGLAWALAADTEGGVERAVWAAQSEDACAMAMSLERGHAVELVEAPPRGTLADSRAQGVSPEAFERARAALAGVVVVAEAQIASAMEHAHLDMGLVLEGAAAVALAPVLFGLPEPLRGGDLVVVLTGRNVDPDHRASIASLATGVGGRGSRGIC
jgi:threonine dehydratase